MRRLFRLSSGFAAADCGCKFWIYRAFAFGAKDSLDGNNYPCGFIESGDGFEHCLLVELKSGSYSIKRIRRFRSLSADALRC